MQVDVIIVGTGGVGSAAAMHLAKRGVKALGIDRFPGGHDRGSSHGHTRIIRLAYFEHPDYVPLLRRAYDLWAELELAHDEKLFHQVGLLEVGPPNGLTIQGVLASAREHRLDIDALSAKECRERFPGFVVPDSLAAVFEARAGYLLVERCVLAHLEQARRHGAEFVVGESVRRWTATASGVVVETDRNTYHAGRLILAAGPWAGRFLDKPLEVRRKHIHWYPSSRPELSVDRGCPTFYFETGVGDFYGFPDIDGRGVKVGEHSGGAIVQDPLADDRSAEPADQARIEDFLTKHMPGVGRPVRDHAVCYYTMSPDSHFLVGAHPDHPNVAFAAGLSGHGFKFTPVLGEILADLVMDGSTKLPIGFLSPRRFGQTMKDI